MIVHTTPSAAKTKIILELIVWLCYNLPTNYAGGYKMRADIIETYRLFLSAEDIAIITAEAQKAILFEDSCPIIVNTGVLKLRIVVTNQDHFPHLKKEDSILTLTVSLGYLLKSAKELTQDREYRIGEEIAALNFTDGNNVILKIIYEQ